MEKYLSVIILLGFLIGLYESIYETTIPVLPEKKKMKGRKIAKYIEDNDHSILTVYLTGNEYETTDAVKILTKSRVEYEVSINGKNLFIWKIK